MGRHIDLTNQKFGMLTALKVSEHGGHHKSVKWECSCVCGNIRTVDSQLLRRGLATHCGCLLHTRLVGKRFGHLVVECATDKRSGSNIVWKCKCDCGNYTEVISSNLTNSPSRRGTISCGCVRKYKSTKHNLSKTKLYKTLVSIKGRCNNPNNPNYERYGGRGITVCDEWSAEDGYLHFYNWSIENGYKEGLSIDRIDNNAGYSPDNCRWVTHKKNTNNTRRCKAIAIGNECHTISEWADIKGVSPGLFYSRRQRGWSDYDTIMKPVIKKDPV